MNLQPHETGEPLLLPNVVYVQRLHVLFHDERPPLRCDVYGCHGQGSWTAYRKNPESEPWVLCRKCADHLNAGYQLELRRHQLRRGTPFEVRALSVREPWATLLVNGLKTIECRRWSTKYRGALLICASGRMDRRDRDNARHFIDHYPRLDFRPGYALGLVKLTDCRPMTKADEDRALCGYQDGTIAWCVEHAHRLREPFEVKGRLGLFTATVPEGVL